MEVYNLDRDIPLFYKQAISFPMGVGGAFAELQVLLPDNHNRRFYGISHPDQNGAILYRAATEEAYPGEGREKGCETFLIRKGCFISLYLSDWRKDERSIGRAFQELLHYPGIDPKGYCLEIYETSADVRCLVPLES